MKSYPPLSSFLLLSILVSLPIFWGKGRTKIARFPASCSVDQADLPMKECDFDKNAETMELFEALKGMYL